MFVNGMRRFNMNNTFKEAVQEALDRYDYILETHKTKDFVEIIGSIGGDVERVRVYHDGSRTVK
jgi:hypothetical protein